MFVKKYTFLNNLTGGTGYNINIPIGNNSGMVGQQEIIEKDFIDIEVNKAVNDIFDYEKVKLIPIHDNTDGPLDNITYVVNLLDTTLNNFNTSLKWSDITFTDDDLRFKKKSFTKSFLKLDFYDSDLLSNQNLVSSITLFPDFTNEDMITGSIPQAVNYSVSFKLGNSLFNDPSLFVDNSKSSEGFSLYHFKDEVLPNPLPPKKLYMKATFNNAKNGTSTGLMSSDITTLSIDVLVRSTENITPYGSVKNNLHTKYILSRDSTGYSYKIDTDYSDNVKYESPTTTTTSPTNDYIINLYQVKAI
jgi:hypothetical protein